MGDIKSVYHEKAPRNTIVGQDPLPGYQVFEGSIVHLSVNRKTAGADPSMLSGMSGVGLFRYRLDSGFLKRRIRVRLNSYGVSNDLFDDFVSPGEDIWFLIPKHQDATVLLYVDGVLERTEVF
jgi:serine/threonine-protein kinase